MSKVSLRQIVLEFLNSKDEGSDRFRRLYRIATLQGVRKFNMDITGEFKTVLLGISPNHTVAFPKDCLDYSMIGITNSAGEAVPLKHNEDLVTIKQGYIEALQKVVPVPKLPTCADNVLSNPGFPFFWLNYWDGSGYTHLYGASGGQGIIGEFTIDVTNNCIQVNPGFPYGEIVLEYLSNGYDPDCDEYKIHTFATDAFMAWLRWKDAIDQNKKFSTSTVNYLRLEFGREKKLAKIRLNPTRIAEMQRVFREYIKLAARA